MALQSIKGRFGTADTRRVTPPAKRAEPFYLSPEWRAFIAAVIAERRPMLMATQGHLCEDPRCKARHSATMRIFGDHVVELRDGGAPFDRSNVMLRCGSSHTRKTIAERVARLARPA
jgi:5-methylcytosine-specific restriction protein A